MTPAPTPVPTLAPTLMPTQVPTLAPTSAPTLVPAQVPITPPNTPVCFSGSNLTIGSPFDQQTCPNNSCIEKIQVTVSEFDGEPVFSGLTATCINLQNSSATNISFSGTGYDSTAPVTSIEVRSGACFQGISGYVDVDPYNDNGLYVSTLVTDEQPPQTLGYISNAPPYNVSTRPLGSIQCNTGSYFNAIYGRSGVILDALCFVCS